MKPTPIRTGLFASFCAGVLLSTSSHALNVSVIGVFPGKAVLVLDTAQPKTYSVGASLAGEGKLISVDKEGATIEVAGKKSYIPIGQYVNQQAGSSNKVVLQADTNGHFYSTVQINGGTVRVVVDTGATTIALPAEEAVRLNINYRKGKLGASETANGRVPVYFIKLDTVKLGDIELHSVDAVVIEQGLNIGLLGMSFLSRTDMHHEGSQITLLKRY